MKLRSLLVLLWFGFLEASALAQTGRQLFVTGGGYRSQDGIREAVRAASAVKAGPLTVVYIGYASQQPKAGLKSYAAQLEKEGIRASQIIPLLSPPRNEAEELEHAKLLEMADLIVQCGGDQSRLVPALKKPAVYRALRARYEARVPVVVTSASAAALGPRMFTGRWTRTPEGTLHFETAEGLNWLPQIIVDTHFLAYRLLGEDATSGVIGREGRAVDALTRGELENALGFDEDAMGKIVDEKFLTVIGPQQILAYRRSGEHVERVPLWSGDGLDLDTWTPAWKNPGAACAWVFAGSAPLKRAPITYLPAAAQ